MTFGSLFSGCGAFDLGLRRAGMSGVWQCEIDSRCRELLSTYWPDTPRHDDVRTFDAKEFVRPDLIVGGFPCQDLSVAGRRAGLSGERSGLWWEYRRIISEFLPGWVLIENVPGLLSSNGGRDMGTIIGSLGELGYGFAYRVLDAQWFGVPQRRRRVFVVGCLGDWRRAAEVLFERDCLPWDSPPSRKARTRVAASLTAGTSSGSGVSKPGRRREDDVNIVAFAQNQRDEVRDLNGIAGALASEPGMKQQTYIAQTAATLNSGGNNGGFRTEPGEHFVAHTLRGEGHDASEDGTGRGVPLVAHALTATATATGRLDPNGETFIPIDMRQASRGGTMTNNRKEGSSGGAPGTGIGENGDPSPTIATDHIPAVCFAIQERAVSESMTSGPGGKGYQEEVAYTMEARHHAQNVANRSGVRRLTPRECERLQGLPDDWTRYDASGKEISDSKRYHMIGNAGAVPVLEWIGRRIVEAQ
jgi:DNA (cytosine-5)-methyltransferase 1